MPRPLRVATRGSELARWQANRVAMLLGDDAELVIVTTSGDVRTDVPIHAVGGTGIFVKEVQQAVLEGRADVAVHSAKDLPASPGPEGIVLAAVPERADARDVLVGSTFDALPAGGRVATGSVRRRGAARRPATRSHVRRAARQHPHPAGPRRRVRRHRGGRRRARTPRPSKTRPPNTWSRR